MIVIKGSVYVRSEKGYTKCVLHKKTIKGREVFSLTETKVSVPELPSEYDTLTLPEVIARYGANAVDDDVAGSTEG